MSELTWSEHSSRDSIRITSERGSIGLFRHPVQLPEHRGGPSGSNLEGLMGQMALWILGHVHEAVDINANGTRIIANPGGHPGEFEKPCFMADRVVEVSRQLTAA